MMANIGMKIAQAMKAQKKNAPAGEQREEELKEEEGRDPLPPKCHFQHVG